MMTDNSADVLAQRLSQMTRGDRGELIAELARQARAGSQSGIAGLIYLLGHSGAHVAESASRELVSIGVDSLGLLVEALLDRRRDVHTRGWAARTLGTLQDSRALEPLLDVVMDRTDHSTVRRMATFYLGRLGNRSAVEPLITVLESEDDDRVVRRDAAIALGQLGDHRAIAPLSRLCSDEQLGRFTERALYRLKGTV